MPTKKHGKGGQRMSSAPSKPAANKAHAAEAEALLLIAGQKHARSSLGTVLLACGLSPSESGAGFAAYLSSLASAPDAREACVLDALRTFATFASHSDARSLALPSGSVTRPVARIFRDLAPVNPATRAHRSAVNELVQKHGALQSLAALAVSPHRETSPRTCFLAISTLKAIIGDASAPAVPSVVHAISQVYVLDPLVQAVQRDGWQQMPVMWLECFVRLASAAAHSCTPETLVCSDAALGNVLLHGILANMAARIHPFTECAPCCVVHACVP